MKKPFLFLLPLCLGVSACQVVDTQAEQTPMATGSQEPSYLVYERLIRRNAVVCDDVQSVASSFPDLQYQQFWLNEIPVLEVSTTEMDLDTPIVLFLHGATGNKSSVTYAISKFAREGYRCITFDLPGHGQRTDGAYGYLDIILQAYEDVETILDYYTAKGYNTKKYVIGGFSTGAIVAIYYGTYGKRHPSGVFDVAGVANWQTMVGFSFMHRAFQYSRPMEIEMPSQERLDFFESKNPYYSLVNLTDIPVFIYHGIADDTFSYLESQNLYDDLVGMGDDQATLHFFEGYTHEFSGDYLNLMIGELESVLPTQ